VNQFLIDYFRIPEKSFDRIFLSPEFDSESEGFFCFGNGNTCYGRSQTGVASNVAASGALDASRFVHQNGASMAFPFSFAEVIDNLRLEHYRHATVPARENFASTEISRKLYYFIRTCLPVVVRRQLQKIYFSDWKNIPFPAWPVDFTVDTLHQEALRLLMEWNGIKRLPFIWFWPEGAPSCLIMTHDVETSAGRDFTSALMDIDDAYGSKSSFQVIPEKRYEVSDDFLQGIRKRGFELNVHDLNHDGHLYRERKEFERRAVRINGYVRKYNSNGFRAGAMYRNQDWYDVFDFSYDMSVPNVAHLEPLRGGCCTVMPYFIGKILELPLTLAQDYSLFHILNDYSIDLWKQQLELIGRRHGLMSFITHPDYLVDARARSVYESLLSYLRQLVDSEKVWSAFPGDVDKWWRARNQMRLVTRGTDWEIVGPQSERARLAYAVLEGGRLMYELAGVRTQSIQPRDR